MCTSVRQFALFSLFLLPLGISTAMAEPIGWIERFALAQDREAVLNELIPGSEDYYFYHCLHHQTTGQLDQSEAILKAWLAEHKGQETPVIRGMLDRQRLLTYRESPQRTIDYLISRLGVKLNHAPPAIKGERRYPSELSADVIQLDRLVIDALRGNDPLKPAGMRHLAEKFRSDQTAGLPIQLQDFLKRVDGAYLSNLGDLVVQELKIRPAKEVRFGDLAAHRLLTLDELDQLARQVPAVADDNAFVDAKLVRLRPSADSDPSQQINVRLDYLTRVELYVRTLPASYNSLKAAATYRLLEANLNVGRFDRELFMRYLQLPRTSPIVHPQWIRRIGNHARLGDDFMKVALLPPVGDEQPLVRTYLEHFLRDAEDASAFEPFLQPEYLRRVFAETKLLAGVGDPDQWYRMLSGPQRKVLRDSVQLRLAAENPTHLHDAPAKLIVDIKNIKDLVVRVYEINSHSYYRTHDKPIDTDIDLDGLVATHERTIAFNHPAVERHREAIQIDEISGRGVWIVDLVGKSLRARALIRRGDLHHVDSTSADGMVFTIVDENRLPVAGATMIVGSQEFAADAQGRIVLPPVVNQVNRMAIISDGQISKPVRFPHLRESYDLAAGMHLDRTQVQSGGVAKVLIRPRLKMSGQVIDPVSLTDVSVLVEATDLEGIATTKVIEDIKLDQNQELVVPIRVPARLADLHVTLSGKIAGLADTKQQTLTTDHHWDIAGIRRTEHTRDAFLTKDGEQFVIEVRGRSGEPIAGATVTVSLETTMRRRPVDQTLQSDDSGRIQLTPLSHVTGIRYGVAGGLQHHRDLQLDRVTWPSVIHTTSDSDIQLPLDASEEPSNQRYRLVERRGGQIHADMSRFVQADSGMLTLEALPAGDYQLIDRQTGAITTIASVAGPQMDSVAVGLVRHRSMNPTQPLGIKTISVGDRGLTIQLVGSTDHARVHLYGSRYLDAVRPADALHVSLPSLSGRGIALSRCGYISDLRLGDEYQYVLRRRFAEKYPGVMLPQPGVILNPWETEETTNQSQAVSAGDALSPSAAAPNSAGSMSRRASAEQASQAASSDFDFIADPGVVIANLAADQNGVIEIPGETIEGLPILQVVVSNSTTTIQRTISTSLQDFETVDLRLAQSLSADRAMSFQRAVSIVSKEQPLDLASLGTAQMQIYGDVSSVMKLYQTLINDPRLAEFDVLADWHQLDSETKLRTYAQLASHELHLFLWSHDRKFFDDVVAPYLANKKDKQFVDEWLLENDLTPYTQLWQYNQLNAAERALLAIRLPESNPSIRRELREIVANQRVNNEQVRRQIESALRLNYMNEVADFEEDAYADGRDYTDNFAILKDDDGNGRAETEAMAFGGVRALKRGQREMPILGKALAGGAVVGQAFRGRSGGGMGGGGTFGFFRELDSTKQWAESHYDRIRVVGGPDPAGLIPIDAFWADLSLCDEAEIRASEHILDPVGNRHAALVALAFCGLPLQAGEIGLPDDRQHPYAPAHPVVVVTKRLQTLQPSEKDSSILIGQRFTASSVRNENSDADLDPNEFLTGEPYVGQTVVSNPTAQRRVVDVFWQLPAGSVPLGGSQSTDSRTLSLEPFAVQAIEYQFYFPKAGKFEHYPATVSAAGKLLARGTEKQFRVVDVPAEDDTITWQKLVRTGTPDQLADFLKDANLRKLDWSLVAHRMHDQDVYRTIIRTLGDASLPITELWAYALKHRDESALSQYLSMRNDLIDRVGPVLRSPLLNVDPIARRKHELLEYAPLVRARIHRLGEENEILNPTFLNQYREFMRVLSHRQNVESDEALVLSYYLLIQNRITEAIKTFDAIDAVAVSAKLQYDYMKAYLAMHRGNVAVAQQLARQHADHPVPRWRARFRELGLHLQQQKDLMVREQLVSLDKSTSEDDSAPTDGIIQGSGDLALMDRDRRQQTASTMQPDVGVRVEGNTLRIDHRNAKDVTMNLYGVDLELLFSKAPFVREDLQRMAMVRPMQSETITFDDETGVGRYELNENLQRQTLLVEVVAGASRSTALFYGGRITTYVSESFGQLQTTDVATSRPISTAYVKVYAKYPGGDVRFYKDGYTDARGRFDYASVSAADAKGAERFAILVMSEEEGATLHDVAPPNR
tara:strand:+ start:203827 stop:210162 length:6336 start_codon:yes stop_codon:yes gene_type:complete